eukprot:scaffold16085_cov127-Skeletonema_marinoi.AAC.5
MGTNPQTYGKVTPRCWLKEASEEGRVLVRVQQKKFTVGDGEAHLSSKQCLVPRDPTFENVPSRSIIFELPPLSSDRTRCTSCPQHYIYLLT